MGYRAKRVSILAVCLLTLLVVSGTIFIKGITPPSPTGTWAAAGNGLGLSSPRAGAAAVQLQDGRILITGGDDGSGAVATVDIYDTLGNFSAAASMNVARSNHTATLLQDGTVLVAGGLSSGAATSSAEIYNPSTNTWAATSGSLISARAGQTATALPDGTVLIAGGDNGGSPLNSLEIYDPASGTFSKLAGSLSSPREQHAAAALSTGDVLIAGGFNGSAALSTTDIYSFSTGKVGPGPAMSTPRQGLSATTQLDGNVLIAGGNNGSANGSQDLASAEVYSAGAGTFSLTGSLATPRQGHQAFLLPHNGSILIVGGTTPVSGVETATSSVEVYYPLASGTDANPNWNGTFNATGAMASPRVSATGSPLSNGTPTSLNDGILLVAGGKDASRSTLSSGELYGFAWIKTDATDYAPGTTVNITGGGWKPGETVTLHFQESPYFDTHPDLTAIADSNGNISNSLFAPDSHDISIRFYLTATGSASQAQTTFTDSINLKGVTVGTQAGTLSSGTAGSATYGVTANYTGNGTNSVDPVGLTFVGWTGTAPTGVSELFSPTSVTNGSPNSTLKITTSATTQAGTFTFTVQAKGADGTIVTGTGTLTVGPGAVSASTSTVVAVPTSVVADGSTTSTITVTLEDANGNVVPGKNVTLSAGSGSSTITTVNGTTNASGQATFTVKDTKVESVTYTAKDTTDSPNITISQTTTVSFTVGAVSATKSTVSANPTLVTADGTTTSTITVTVLDANSNPVSGKTVSLTAGSGSSTISAPSGSSNASGVVTFTVKDTKAEAVTYTAKDTSDNITITQTAQVTFKAGVAAKLAFSQQPSTTNAGSTITPAVTVSVEDGNGNVVTTDNSTVTIAISTGGAFSGTSTLSAAASAGVATFSNLIPTASGTFTLSATDGSLTAATSNSFTVNAGTLAKFVFANITSPQTAGTAFNVTITAEDTNGNTVTAFSGNGNNVMLTSTGTLVGAPVTTGSFTNGVLIQSVTITNTGSFTITATGNAGHGGGTGTSNSFTVNPGPAATLTVTGYPSPVTAGIAHNFTVTAKDSNGNVATGYTGTVKFTSTDVQASLPASSTLTNGTGTFSATLKTAGTQSITATDNATSTITGTQGGITVNAATAASVTATAGSGQSTTINTAFATNLASTVKDAFNNPVSGATVTFTPPGSGASGAFTGTNTATTNASGVATANTFTANGTAGSYIVSASTSGATSASFSLTNNQASTTTSISLSSSSITIGASTTVTATVAPKNTTGTPTGTVSVSDGLGGAGDTCTITLSGGTGTCQLTPSANGSLTVTGIYNGDGNFTGSQGSTGLSVTGTPPSFTSGNSTSFTAGTAGTFTVSASGIPAPALSESTGAGQTGLPGGVTFTDNGGGSGTLAGTATVAGVYTFTIMARNGISPNAIQAFTLTVNAGSFTQLQILAPGETAAPGTTTGKTGTPNIEYVNGQFPVTVNATDANWNVVSSVTDTVHFTSTDTSATTILPADTALANGTGTFNVTLETPENTPTTTITASDVTDSTKTSDTSSKIEVIVAYTAAIVPAMVATGQPTTYTLTISNAAAPNTNNLESATVAVPTADQGTTITVDSVSATTQPGNAAVNWTYDASQLPGTLRFSANTGSDAVAPGGTITITFTATSSAPVSSSPVQEVWNTVAFSDSKWTSPLPLAPPEPTTSVGVGPSFTSGASATFTHGTPGSFTVTTNGVPTNKLTESGTPPGVTFTDNGDDTATITSTSTTPAGTYYFTITAHNGFGSDATQNFTLTVNKASQTIAITQNAPSTAVYNTSFMVSATGGGSGNAITFTPVAGSVCSVGAVTNSSGTFTAPVTMTSGTGTCQLDLNQAGNTNYLAAPQVMTATTTAQKASQTITVTTPAPAMAFYNAQFTVVATASSGNAVTYSPAGVCSNTGGTFTMTSGTGTCTVNIDQAGDANYNAAAEVQESVTAERVPQTITFGALSDQTFGDPPFAVSATASSGLAVVFSSTTPSVCTTSGANGGTVTLIAAGTCTIEADQFGNTNYLAAPSVTQSFNVNKADTTTSVAVSPGSSTLGDLVTLTATVADASGGSTGTPTGLVTFFDGTTPIGSGVLNRNASDQATFTTSLLAFGSHQITASYDGDANFNSTGADAGSTASGTSETVNLRSTSVGVSLNPTTVVVGQSSKITITVTDSGTTNPPGTADSFTSTGATGTGTTGATSTLFGDGLVLVAGGLNSGGKAVKSAYIYSTSTGTFAATGNLNTARTGATATLLPNGKILIAGGSSDGTAGGALNTAELYDPATGKFSLAGGNSSSVMTAARFGATATLLQNGQGLIAGGENSGGAVGSAELYNSATDTFTATGSLAAPRHGAAATLLANGNVLIAGGTGGSGPLSSAELYSGGTFTSAGTMNVARTGATATLLLNGSVLVAGGSSDGTTALSSAELYASGTFTPSSSTLNTARFNGTATGLPNGMVLLAGGDGGNTAELYDADSDKFDATGSLIKSNQAITATLLNNGDVLIAGLTSGGSPAADAEVFAPSFNPLGTVALSSSEATDSFSGTCVLTPSTATASACDPTVTPANVATSPHSITGTYSADAVHSGNANNASLTVQKATPAFSNLTAPLTIAYGTASITVSGNLAAPTATPPNADSVTVSINGTAVSQTVTLSGGAFTATLNTASIPASATPYAISYSFAGDSNFNAASDNTSTTLTVQKATPAFSNLSSPLSILYGTASITVSGKLAAPTAAPPNADSVTVSVNGTSATQTVALSSGAFTATLNTALNNGVIAASVTPYAISYSFAGDSNFNAASNNTSTTLTVNPAPLMITASSPAMIYGGPVPPITPGYSGFVNGDSAASLTTQAACGTAATSASPVGAYPSTCLGAVDPNYMFSYVPGTVTVNQATTTTTVTSSTNGASIFLQPVTFTATVTPQFTGVPGGTVTFYDAGSNTSPTCASPGTQIGTVQPLNLVPGADSASVTTATLSGTTHTILACSSGDTNFLQSSGTVGQTVTPAPVVMVAPPTISFTGQSVGVTSSPMNITLTNIGDAPLDLSGFSIVNSANPTEALEFAIQSNSCSSTFSNMLPGEYQSPAPASYSCTIAVTFTPKDTGESSATLQISDNNDDNNSSQQNVALEGGGLSTIAAGGTLYQDAVFATGSGCGSIVLSGGSTIDSFNSLNGFSSSHQLSGANVGTNGNITLSGGKSAIYGSASVLSTTSGNCSKTAVTGLTSSGGAQAPSPLNLLGGVVSYPAPPAPNPAPPTTSVNVSHSCPSGMNGCTNTGSNTVTLAPGSYGNVQFSGGTTVYLNTGTYNINSLALTGNSVLRVGSGPVIINIAGAGLSGNNPALDPSGGSIVNPTGIPSNLQFYYGGSRGVNFSGGSQAYATVYAPMAPVNMSGGTDFFGGLIGLSIGDSGGTAIHYDTNLTNVPQGDTIWLTAVINNLNVNSKAVSSKAGQIKLYLTNSTVSFAATAGQCTGAGETYNSGTSTCTVAVPNAVVTLNSASATSPKTSYDLTNNRWVTSVPPSDLTGNTFVAGVAIPVPAGGFPSGLQKVSWSTAFSTDTSGVTFQWQWNAGVYNTAFNTCYAYQSTNSSNPCYNATSNTNLLGVNPEDGSADINGTDQAGTPETYKKNEVIGFFSAPSGVAAAAAEMSTSPSNLAFTSSGQAMVSVLTNNDGVIHYISGFSITGTNAPDFTLQPSSSGTPNSCVGMASLAAGLSCNLYVVYTKTAAVPESARIVVNDDANNTPQSVYLTGP